MIARAKQHSVWGVAIIVGDRETAERMCNQVGQHGATVWLLRVDADHAELVCNGQIVNSQPSSTTARDVLIPLAIAIAAAVVAVLLM